MGLGAGRHCGEIAMDAMIREVVQATYQALAPVAAREDSEALRMGLTLGFVSRTTGGYSGKRVLDLGSSLGVHLVAAKRLGAVSAIGLDRFIFPDAFDNDFILQRGELEALQRAWQTEGVEIHRHDLADALPFPDESFDLVVCNAVIEHLHGIHKQLFAEVRRVLAPGGSFVFTTPNLASLLKRVRFVFGRSPMWDLRDYFGSGREFTGHVREFTVTECTQMLAWSGLVPTTVTSRPSYFRWSWLKNPSKFHNVFFQLASRLWPTWGDLVFAAGKKLSSVK